MKKSLIAFAALAATAGVAQAQSSVTIYGIVDLNVASVTSVKNGSANQTVTGMGNGGLATSRLGFMGTEDLGGGLKAGFQLEAELLAANGSQDSTPGATGNLLFARQSTVNLSGDFGQIKLGRMDTLAYATGATMNALGGGNIGSFVAVSNYGLAARVKNAVQYTSPTFNGFKVLAQTGINDTVASTEVAGMFDANRINNYELQYANGPVAVAAEWGSNNNSDGTRKAQLSGVHATYDFGTVKLLGGFVQIDNTGALKVTHSHIGAQYAINSATKLNVQYNRIQNQAANATPSTYAAALVYSLSKRTDLYGIVATSQQDGTTSQRLVSDTKMLSFYGTNNGVNQNAFAVGIKHAF